MHLYHILTLVQSVNISFKITIVKKLWRAVIRSTWARVKIHHSATVHDMLLLPVMPYFPCVCMFLFKSDVLNEPNCSLLVFCRSGKKWSIMIEDLRSVLVLFISINALCFFFHAMIPNGFASSECHQHGFPTKCIAKIAKRCEWMVVYVLYHCDY